jgi:hypothetical protein
MACCRLIQQLNHEQSWLHFIQTGLDASAKFRFVCDNSRHNIRLFRQSYMRVLPHFAEAVVQGL